MLLGHEIGIQIKESQTDNKYIIIYPDGHVESIRPKKRSVRSTTEIIKCNKKINRRSHE